MLFIQLAVVTRTQIVRTARAFGPARLTAVATRMRVVRTAGAFHVAVGADQLVSYSFT